MENFIKELELLYELQAYDGKINDIKKQISQAPSLIEEKNKTLEARKIEFSAKKKNLAKLNLLKKEKEELLDEKEKAISKHLIELNSVKSNDIYKALLGEIEKANFNKSILESEILEFMDEIDKKSIILEKTHKELREFENNIKTDISRIEISIKKLEEKLTGMEKVRKEHELKIDRSILSQYERLRLGCGWQVIALVNEGSCGVCGMVLRPQLINQAKKAHDLVFCDNCSRILLKSRV
jgi:predicted  nucleic acid-binding Zn-ribbon protein